MVKRNPKNRLERWEVALVKAMLAKGTFGNDQDILAYFTRPTRSINHRAISEIRTETKHAKAKPATDEELQRFLDAWPQIDPATAAMENVSRAGVGADKADAWLTHKPSPRTIAP